MKKIKHVSKEEFLKKEPINNPNYYAIITAEVRYSNNISDSAKLLYGEITALSNKKGYAYPSNAYLANLYEVSISTIQRRLKELKDNGFIDVVLIKDNETNEVLQRQIYPINKNDRRDHRESDTTPHSKSDMRPHSKSDTRPHSKSDLYNNTRVNIINNNNKGVVVSQTTIDKIKDKTKNRLTEEDIQNIILQTGATEETLIKMVDLMINSKRKINNIIGWLIKAIEDGYDTSKTIDSKASDIKNDFHNFQTSGKEYTNEELLDKLVNRN